MALVGLLHALVWCAAYPLFVGAWQLVSVFSQRPPSALLLMATVPITLLAFMYACTCLFVAPALAWIGALIIQKVDRYRLSHRSWVTVFSSGVFFSALCMILMALRLHFLPPEFVAEPAPAAPPYLTVQHRIHTSLWPMGVATLGIVLSFVSATFAFLVFRARMDVSEARAP
jgi:hypothetical protein